MNVNYLFYKENKKDLIAKQILFNIGQNIKKIIYSELLL